MTTIRKNDGFTLIELLIVVAIIGIIAAIAVPGLMRARQSGNEASAIGSMRAINSAQATFAASCAGRGFATSLVTLATPPAGSTAPFISDDLLANPTTKSGYTIEIGAGTVPLVVTAQADTCNNLEDAMSQYHATATPVTVGSTGQRAFATNQSGSIWQNNTGAAIANTMAGAAILQ